MNQPLPQLLPHCDYSHFCESCRELERGRGFRSGVLRRQGITCDVDFACPKGKPWNRQRLKWLRIPKPGDTAHWLANLTLVGPAFRGWLKLTGSKCQCEKRRREWNEAGWLGLTKQLFKRK